MTDLIHNHYRLYPKFSQYQNSENNMIAIQMFTRDHQPYMTATFNPVEVISGDHTKGCAAYDFSELDFKNLPLICVKDYSENYGIEKSLHEAGLIDSHCFVKEIQTGHFATSNVYYLYDQVFVNYTVPIKLKTHYLNVN